MYDLWVIKLDHFESMKPIFTKKIYLLLPATCSISLLLHAEKRAVYYSGPQLWMKHVADDLWVIKFANLESLKPFISTLRYLPLASFSLSFMQSKDFSFQLSVFSARVDARTPKEGKQTPNARLAGVTFQPIKLSGPILEIIMQSKGLHTVDPNNEWHKGCVTLGNQNRPFGVHETFYCKGNFHLLLHAIATINSYTSSPFSQVGVGRSSMQASNNSMSICTSYLLLPLICQVI